MAHKPTRKDRWNSEAVALLRKHKTCDERVKLATRRFPTKGSAN